MNPQNTSRPVMDVSAPRPQSVATPPASDAIAVQPAPLNLDAAKPSPALDTKPKTAHVPTAAQQKSGAPIGVITVAVLVMMLLSAAAVIVYASSQTA